jgi:ABC-type multidrug transport system fused ATPase/permease subunit
MSVADNNRYGEPSASDAQVEAAARAALVHDFATALPQGYATIIGEGGHKLSQGERQRLVIARALCKKPALVVLDEATSSLDTPSEALIQAALANLLRGRTAFIIAHRLSTIIDADVIVVMDGGLVVQRGTHAQLLADREGLYRRLCARQFGEPAVAVGQPRAIPPGERGWPDEKLVLTQQSAHPGLVAPPWLPPRPAWRGEGARRAGEGSFG